MIFSSYLLILRLYCIKVFFVEECKGENFFGEGCVLGFVFVFLRDRLIYFLLSKSLCVEIWFMYCGVIVRRSGLFEIFSIVWNVLGKMNTSVFYGEGIGCLEVIDIGSKWNGGF